MVKMLPGCAGVGGGGGNCPFSPPPRSATAHLCLIKSLLFYIFLFGNQKLIQIHHYFKLFSKFKSLFLCGFKIYLHGEWSEVLSSIFVQIYNRVNYWFIFGEYVKCEYLEYLKRKRTLITNKKVTLPLLPLTATNLI